MAGSQEKKQGHEAERATDLHDKLKSFLGEGKVSVDGTSGTKTDLMVGNKRISQKTPSGKSTQVWLPTKTTLFTHVPSLSSVKSQILELLGSPTIGRKKTTDINAFSDALTAMNDATKDGSLPTKMFLQVDKEDPVQYISWVLKKRGGGGITVIDAKKYVDYIILNGEWISAPGGTTLWLVDKKDPTKKFAHLQRKGSPSKDKHKDGQYYAPMFHIHNYWPEGTVVGNDKSFSINGI